ncbi:MAG: 2-dehydropantoate 2-reductase [Acidobacteriota bacterium]|nr:2-dehydropantoate 2-reductase [Acidobacteriota bacterium]
MIRVAILGSGAVGGFYGALLARQGHDVAFIARGAHLDAIRAHGLRVRGAVGDFAARGRADSDAAALGHADLVLVAIKTYDNHTALPMLRALCGPSTVVLTLQNGVDSVDDVAAIVGRDRVLGGATYVATAIAAPGVIEQTGTHRRIVFGEVFGATAEPSARVRAIAEAMAAADIHAEPVADARPSLWEKFVYLAPFAGLTGAARQPIGPLRDLPGFFDLALRACAEVASVARAEGVTLPADLPGRLRVYMDALPPSTRSSLLIDLRSGKRIEVESLQGSVVRRAAAAGVDVPIMQTLYSVLKPWAAPK